MYYYVFAVAYVPHRSVKTLGHVKASNLRIAQAGAEVLFAHNRLEAIEVSEAVNQFAAESDYRREFTERKDFVAWMQLAAWKGAVK